MAAGGPATAAVEAADWEAGWAEEAGWVEEAAAVVATGPEAAEEAAAWAAGSAAVEAAEAAATGSEEAAATGWVVGSEASVVATVASAAEG